MFVYRNPKSSPHVLQLADMQSTSLFVLDAESIVALAIAVNRTEVVPRLRARAAQMKAQLAKAWDNQTESFLDIYPATGEFSDKLTPTAFYPLFAGAATDQQAITLVQNHLLNSSEFASQLNMLQIPTPSATEGCRRSLPTPRSCSHSATFTGGA